MGLPNQIVKALMLRSSRVVSAIHGLRPTNPRPSSPDEAKELQKTLRRENRQVFRVWGSIRYVRHVCMLGGPMPSGSTILTVVVIIQL